MYGRDAFLPMLDAAYTLKCGNPARLMDNATWTAPVSYLQFLRDIGKHFSVNMMVAKESVRSRMEDRDSRGGGTYVPFDECRRGTGRGALRGAWDAIGEFSDGRISRPQLGIQEREGAPGGRSRAILRFPPLLTSLLPGALRYSPCALLRGKRGGFCAPRSP